MGQPGAPTGHHSAMACAASPERSSTPSAEVRTWSTAQLACNMALIASLLISICLGIAQESGVAAICATIVHFIYECHSEEATDTDIRRSFYTTLAISGFALISFGATSGLDESNKIGDWLSFAMFFAILLIFLPPVLCIVSIATAYPLKQPDSEKLLKLRAFWSGESQKKSTTIILCLLPGALFVCALPFIVMQTDWPIISPNCVNGKRELLPTALMLTCAVVCYYGGIILGLTSLPRELEAAFRRAASNHSPIAAPHT